MLIIIFAKLIQNGDYDVFIKRFDEDCGEDPRVK